MNPLESFLSEYPRVKTAGFLDSVGGAFRDAGAMAAKNFPEQAAQGLATAGAAAGIAGIGMAGHALMGAVTKGRDFRKMLSFNEDLAAMHRENPKYVNAAFSTLHRMNSEFAGDPMVAGGFVRQMVATPEAAFGLAGQAAGFAPKPSAIQQAGIQGIGAGVQPSQTPGRQTDTSRMQALFRAQGQPNEVPGPMVPGARAGSKPGKPVKETSEQVVSRMRSFKP